jgi:hypothetical protein
VLMMFGKLRQRKGRLGNELLYRVIFFAASARRCCVTVVNAIRLIGTACDQTDLFSPSETVLQSSFPLPRANVFCDAIKT